MAYHKNLCGDNLSIFPCTKEIDVVLLFLSIFVIYIPCIKGQFAYVSSGPKSCICFFSKAVCSAGQHIPESMLHSPKKWLILFPSSFNIWSHRRGSASGNRGFLKLLMGQHFSVSCIVLHFNLAHPESGSFQAESIRGGLTS